MRAKSRRPFHMVPKHLLEDRRICGLSDLQFRAFICVSLGPGAGPLGFFGGGAGAIADGCACSVAEASAAIHALGAAGLVEGDLANGQLFIPELLPDFHSVNNLIFALKELDLRPEGPARDLYLGEVLRRAPAISAGSDGRTVEDVLLELGFDLPAQPEALGGALPEALGETLSQALGEALPEGLGGESEEDSEGDSDLEGERDAGSSDDAGRIRRFYAQMRASLADAPATAFAKHLRVRESGNGLLHVFADPRYAGHARRLAKELDTCARAAGFEGCVIQESVQ